MQNLNWVTTTVSKAVSSTSDLDFPTSDTIFCRRNRGGEQVGGGGKQADGAGHGDPVHVAAGREGQWNGWEFGVLTSGSMTGRVNTVRLLCFADEVERVIALLLRETGDKLNEEVRSCFFLQPNKTRWPAADYRFPLFSVSRCWAGWTCRPSSLGTTPSSTGWWGPSWSELDSWILSQTPSDRMPRPEPRLPWPVRWAV